MKDITLKIFAGIDSHATGYDLVMRISGEQPGDIKFIRRPITANGMKRFYKKSNSWQSTQWEKQVNFPQYRKMFGG
jgi:hypothetical protein